MNNKLILAYLRLLRIPAVFTAMSNILAAHFIAGQGQIEWLLLLKLLAISSLLYSAGMVLNDCFDMEEDRRERPSRPLPAGQIPVMHAWLMGWGFIIAALLISSSAGWLVFSIAALLAAFVIGYDAYLKRTIFASLSMGSCRYLNWLLGMSVAGLSWHSFLVPLPIFIYISSLTYLSQIETRADNKSHVIICMLGMGVSAGMITLFQFLSIYPNPWVFVFLIPALLIVLRKTIHVYHKLSSANVQALVGFFILGVIPLDAMLVFASGPWWGGIVVMLLILPSRFLARLIYVT